MIHCTPDKFNDKKVVEYQSVSAARVTMVGALSRFPVEATSGNRLSSILPIKYQKTSRSLLSLWAFTDHDKMSQLRNFSTLELWSWTLVIFTLWKLAPSKLKRRLRTSMRRSYISSYVLNYITPKSTPISPTILRIYFYLNSNCYQILLSYRLKSGIWIFNFDHCRCWMGEIA